MIPRVIKFHKRRCGQNTSYLIVLKSQIWGVLFVCLLVLFLDFTVYPERAEILTHLKGFGYVFSVTKIQVETKHQNNFHLLGVENSTSGKVIILSTEVFVLKIVGIENSAFT